MKKTMLLFSIFAMLLSACNNSTLQSNSKDGDNSGGGDSIVSGLELIAFGRYEELQKNTSNEKKNVMKQPLLLDDGKTNRNKTISIDEEYHSDEETRFMVQVRNVNRLSFVDLVLYSDTTKTSYAFNEGNGEYTCATTTVNIGDEWVTNISFFTNKVLFKEGNDSCGYKTYLEIKEICFLSFSNDNVKADVDKNNVKKLDFNVLNSKYPHTWGEWVYEDGQKQYEPYTGKRECLICHVIEEETLVPTCMNEATIFEAEYCPCITEDNDGRGMYGMVSGHAYVGKELINVIQDNGNNAGYCVKYLHSTNDTLLFEIYSDGAVDNAIMSMCLGPDGCFNINENNYGVKVNGSFVHYNGIQFYSIFGNEKSLFKDCYIGNNISLISGKNTIELVTLGAGDSYVKESPAVDNIKIYSTSNLTWPTAKQSNLD